MKLNVDFIYPVGSIYMSTNSTNPNVLFGGNWEQIKDTFLLACGNTYANGQTGGEATHKLTVSEIPRHRHSASEAGNTDYATGCITGMGNYAGKNGGRTWYSSYEGGDQPHNNMPPYLAVYVWKRTA